MTTATKALAANEVRQEFILPIDQVLNLQRLAAGRHVSENELVAKALDIFRGMAELVIRANPRRSAYTNPITLSRRLLKKTAEVGDEEIF
jgi:hypothetical protein